MGMEHRDRTCVVERQGKSYALSLSVRASPSGLSTLFRLFLYVYGTIRFDSIEHP